MSQASKELDDLLDSGELDSIYRISSEFEYLLGDTSGILTWQKKLEEIINADNIVIEWDGESFQKSKSGCKRISKGYH